MDTQELVMDDPSHVAVAEAVSTAGAPRATARLIEYVSGGYFALPPHTTMEIIEHPAIVAVPAGAYYTCGMLAWRGQYIPVIHIDMLLRAYQDSPVVTAPRYALVVAYQCAPNNPIKYGALSLKALPETIEVGDESWCELPTSSDLWPLLSISCFQYNKIGTPIVDTAKLFMSHHG